MNNVRSVYSISPTVLALKIDVGTVERGLGNEPDRFTSIPLRDEQLFNRLNFRVSSRDALDDVIRPTSISLKKRTTDVAFLNRFTPFNPDTLEWAQEYTLYLTLPAEQALIPGETYTLDFARGLDNRIADVESFTYEPEQTFSESIHISQIGFDPDDPKIAFLDDPKIAFLSEWQGVDESGNPVAAEFAEGLRFWIVNAETGQRVENNRVIRRTELSLAATEDEDIRSGFQNYTEADVYELNFSDFSRPGNYAIEVEGVGRSFDFSIGEDNWEKAFQVSMRGLYNQRSGTAIGSPFSDAEFPRSFHPDDGVRVFAVDDRTIRVNGENIDVEGVQLIDTQESDTDNTPFDQAFSQYVQPFDRNDDGEVTGNELAAQIEPLTEAWGG